MEWWSNTDSLQRIAFIPHILFGQIVSYLILLGLMRKNWHLSNRDLLKYALSLNILGLIFPPSLITLDAVIFLLAVIRIIKSRRLNQYIPLFLIVLFSLPSQIYLLIMTRQIPWVALVAAHEVNHMLIPFSDFLLSLGPVVFLCLLGIVFALINRQKNMIPFILYLVVTYFFAIVFTYYQAQSPLRFTQTGLQIPLGILATYALYCLTRKISREIIYGAIMIYILISFYTMYLSWQWQYSFITARAHANIPAVPYPPQTMYPLKSWMDAIRYLRDYTLRSDVVLADITAGNYIPAYAANTVYFGQVNTYDYDNKYALLQIFFKGDMNENQAKTFLLQGNIKYIFFGPQEKDLAGGRNLEEIYPFLKTTFQNDTVKIYSWH